MLSNVQSRLKGILKVSNLLKIVIVLLLVLLVYKTLQNVLFTPRYNDKYANAVDVYQEQESRSKDYIEKYKAKINALKGEKGLYYVNPPKAQIPQIDGLFGDLILVGDKVYTVGDKINGAEVVEIFAASVKIMWEGKEMMIEPMQAGGQPVASNNGGRESRGGARGGGNGERDGSQRRGDFFGGTDEERQARFEQMRARFEERMRDMSEEDRQRIRDRIERFMGQGGPGGPGGQGGPGGPR